MKSRLVLTLLVVILATSFVFSQAANTTDTPKDSKQKSECPASKIEKSSAKMDCAKMDHSKMTKKECTGEKGKSDCCDKAKMKENCSKMTKEEQEKCKKECEKKGEKSDCCDKTSMKKVNHESKEKDCDQPCDKEVKKSENKQTEKK